MVLKKAVTMPGVKPSPRAQQEFDLITSVFLHCLSLAKARYAAAKKRTPSELIESSNKLISESAIDDLAISLIALRLYEKSKARTDAHAEAKDFTDRTYLKDSKGRRTRTAAYSSRFRIQEALSRTGVERLRTYVMLGFDLEHKLTGRHPSLKLWRLLWPLLRHLEAIERQGNHANSEKEMHTAFRRLKQRIKQLTKKSGNNRRGTTPKYNTVAPRPFTRPALDHVATHVYRRIQLAIHTNRRAKLVHPPR